MCRRGEHNANIIIMHHSIGFRFLYTFGPALTISIKTRKSLSTGYPHFQAPLSLSLYTGALVIHNHLLHGGPGNEVTSRVIGYNIAVVSTITVPCTLICSCVYE